MRRRKRIRNSLLNQICRFLADRAPKRWGYYDGALIRYSETVFNL